MSKATRVGFIGLGTMGQPFAINIAQADFDLVVHDLRPEPVAELVALGARPAKTPREVAEQADIIDVAVPHEPEVEAVMHGPDGLLAGSHPGTVWAIHSSLHPRNMEKVAEEANEHGIAVLDAQFSGGAGGARNRTLTFMVGGDPDVLQRCRPVLETTAGHIFILGRVGAAALTKNVQNMMQAINLLGAGEGFRLMERAGVDLEVFQEVVRTTGAQSLVGDAYLHQWGLRPVPWVYSLAIENAIDVARGYDLVLPVAASSLETMAGSAPAPDAMRP
jgi:3-hydroxyisobutyrate dehydrogenase-like beta-hydroxyacid dehydrogenase